MDRIWIDWLTGTPVRKKDRSRMASAYFEARPTGSETIRVDVWKCGPHTVAVPYDADSPDSEAMCRSSIRVCGFDPDKSRMICRGFENGAWKSLLGYMKNHNKENDI